MRVPRISPGSTQLKSRSQQTIRPEGLDTSGRGLQAIGKAVENEGNKLYERVNDARNFVENSQFDLIQSEKEAVRINYATEKYKDKKGRTWMATDTPERRAKLASELKEIDERGYKLYTNKDQEARSRVVAQKNNISITTAVQAGWTKNLAINGDASTREKLDNMINSFSGTQEELDDMDALLEAAKRNDIYDPAKAYKMGKNAKEEAKFRFAESELAIDWKTTKDKWENGEYDLTEKQQLLFQSAIDAKERAVARQEKFEQEKLQFGTRKLFTAKFNDGSLTMTDIAKAALPIEDGGVNLSPQNQRTWINLISDRSGPFRYRKGTSPSAYVRLNTLMESSGSPTKKLDAIIDSLEKEEISVDVFNEFMSAIPASYNEASKNNDQTEQNPSKITKNGIMRWLNTVRGLSPDGRVSIMREVNRFANDPGVTQEQIIAKARDLHLNILRSYIPNLDEQPNGVLAINPLDNTFVRVYKSGDIDVVDVESAGAIDLMKKTDSNKKAQSLDKQ